MAQNLTIRYHGTRGARSGAARPFFNDATWPLSTTTLTDAGPGTRMALHWQAFDANDEENATFDGAHAGMTQGWRGTLDQLATYLARVRQRG
jgi:uncharacterized protein YndB with AHSA1/START domain